MRGENNPSYGVKCSVERKNKIGKKAKEKFVDKEYRNNISNKVKQTSLFNFIRETNCLYDYKTVKNENEEVFYYILDKEGKMLYPRVSNKVRNIKRLINENNIHQETHNR